MIAIKPHHFVDIVTSLGRGVRSFAPDARGHALHVVARAVQADPSLMLVVELGADAICLPCRHNVRGLCDDVIDTSRRPAAPSSKREWNLRLDRRWCARLGLGQGERLTVRQLCVRLRDAAGDLVGIYPEEEAARTADRQANLSQGIALLLGGL
ncbi:MAG: hypothetical protein AB1505_07155 [Candidatus Latescibacterota bacterium]